MIVGKCSICGGNVITGKGRFSSSPTCQMCGATKSGRKQPSLPVIPMDPSPSNPLRPLERWTDRSSHACGPYREYFDNKRSRGV